MNDPNYEQANVEKNMDKYKELTEKYKEQVRKKYGITEDIEGKIAVEGLEEGWPME